MDEGDPFFWRRQGREVVRVAGLALALFAGCVGTDTVELGGQCTDSAQCKDPADTCMVIAGKSRCTMACSKEHRCPTGYVCPVTEPSNRAAGSCLPAAEIGPNVVKVY